MVVDVSGEGVMAMNKAEKARIEELERDLAFRWPTEAEPTTIPVPEHGAEATGWRFNIYNRAVEPAWSTGFANGGYYKGVRGSGSQGARRLYQTERDAWIAMRWAICRDYAAILQIVDRQTPGLTQAETPPTTTQGMQQP